MTDRPDIAERYARAITSKRLQHDADKRSDVDMLIAAGWVDESLGTKLWRLRREWDLVRADLQRADEAQTSAWAVARRLQARSQQPLPPEATDGAKQARAAAAAAAVATMSEAEKAALQARSLAMVMLKTLRPAKVAVEAFALGLAARTGFYRANFEVCAIAGKALELYVDPNCGHCNGLGLIVASGAAPSICPVCNGSKRRPMRLGVDEDAERFGQRLGAELERKADYVAGRIRHFTYTRTKMENGASAVACRKELEQRLHELRSAQAQED